MSAYSDFMELTRGYTLPMTFASCLIIFSFAHKLPDFSLVNFLIMVFALCCAHLCANLYDDYKDVKRQLDSGKSLNQVSFQGFRPKAKLILNGTYSLDRVKCRIGFLAILALGIGISFTAVMGWHVLYFIIAGALLIVLYPYASRFYCSEIIVGLAFGPLMIMGGYYALSQTFDMQLFILSMTIFFTTITLLQTHSIMDWEFDVRDNKKTLALLSGTKQDAIKVLAVIVTMPYVIITAGILSDVFKPDLFYVFLTLPIVAKLIPSMKEYIMVKDVKFIPRWYWGFFENWENIKENGLEFFMFRFCLARNFSFFFALFATIGIMLYD